MFWFIPAIIQSCLYIVYWFFEIVILSARSTDFYWVEHRKIRPSMCAQNCRKKVVAHSTDHRILDYNDASLKSAIFTISIIEGKTLRCLIGEYNAYFLNTYEFFSFSMISIDPKYIRKSRYFAIISLLYVKCAWMHKWRFSLANQFFRLSSTLG